MWAALRCTPSRSRRVPGPRLLCGNFASFKAGSSGSGLKKKKSGRPVAAKQGKIGDIIKKEHYWQEHPGCVGLKIITHTHTHAHKGRQRKICTFTIMYTLGISLCYANKLAQMASLLHFGPKNKRSPLVTPGNKMRVLPFPASVVSLVNKNRFTKRVAGVFFSIFFSFFKSRFHTHIQLYCFWAASLLCLFCLFFFQSKASTHTAKYESVTFCLTQGLKKKNSQKSKNMQKNSCGSP